MSKIVAPVFEYKVTSDYGPRIDPVSKKPGQLHNGIDFISKVGDKAVRCVADGVVASDFDNYEHKKRFLERQHFSGNWCSIEHKNELGHYWSVYVHLSENTVTIGQKIDAEQIIGTYANVGYSTGAHLHFSIILYEKGKWIRVNPWPYLPKQ